MKFSLALVVLSAALPFCAAYLEDPPTTADENTVSDCSWWTVAASGDTCTAIAGDWSISVTDFEIVYNPSVGSTCKLILGNSYCVERNYGLAVTTTSTTATATTTAGNGISTPTPTQAGMVSSCNKFYLVQSGDGCATIAGAQGIALIDFYAWNPAVKTDCSALWASVYVCVGVIGSSTTVTTTTSASATATTTTGNGVVTPTPTQNGMVANCNKFYFVQSGDGCATIASAQGIALSDFYSWNPAVKTDCSALWASVYVCVGLIGQTSISTTKTSTTVATTTTMTSAGNGVATPTPTQAGMATNCSNFYFVQSGDGCAAIASKLGITLANFYSWNPAVNTDCSGLWASVYVCVGLIGTTPTTTITLVTSTTKTTAGNGVATPTPTQSGMVGNCDAFHLVVSGDTCYDIANNAGIALAQFYTWNPSVGSSCQTLQLGYYVCTSLI